MSNVQPVVHTDLCEARGGGVCADARDAWPPLPREGVMRVLLLEGDDSLHRAVEKILRDEAVEVVHEIEAAAALDRDGCADLDVIVLDLRDHDGMDVLADLRRLHPHVPVLILTARDAEDMRMEALVRGADDFLVKPFMSVELVARIRTLSRRTGARRSSRNEEILVLDDEHEVRFYGQRVPLSPREYSLLAYLLGRCGDVVTRGDIQREVFGDVAEPNPDAIEAHLVHLSRKLACASVSLETVRGTGIRVKLCVE